MMTPKEGFFLSNDRKLRSIHPNLVHNFQTDDTFRTSGKDECDFCRFGENKENEVCHESFPSHRKTLCSSMDKGPDNNMADTNSADRLNVRRRKSACPARSADRRDPNFRGVTFQMQTQMNGSESQLVVSAYFSNVKLGNQGSVRNRHHSCGSTSPNTDSWSGSDEENLLGNHRGAFMTVKTCASCATRRTPLWRDAEDGTPLCNACGIRFKKYKVRCSQCWHIPKKDIKTFPNCPHCGAPLRVSVCRRSW